MWWARRWWVLRLDDLSALRSGKQLGDPSASPLEARLDDSSAQRLDDSSALGSEMKLSAPRLEAQSAPWLASKLGDPSAHCLEARSVPR